MRLESRLKKLERSVDAGGVEGIRGPADVPQEIWQRALELFTDLPAEELGGWAFGQAVEWCRERQPIEADNLPSPLLDCVARAFVEAETGTLPPPMRERGRLMRADLANWPDDKLIGQLRGLDAVVLKRESRLPWPYSTFLLEEIAEDATERAEALACELRLGAITPQEHAAKLANLLPFTRADLERTVRNFPDEFLLFDIEAALADPLPEQQAETPGE